MSLLSRIFLILISLFGIYTSASAAQDSIAEVLISGNRRIESPAIMTAVKLKSGDKFFEEKIDGDIKSIYALGFFTDVKADKSISDKGIAITYIVTEKPVVREILFEGNKALNNDKLKDAMEIKPNAIFSQKDLMKSIAKIKKLYTDEGYSQAEVEPVKLNTSSFEMKLTLKISEGSKILIREIVFDGNRAFDSSKLKGLMETKQDWWLAWLTGAGVYKDDVLKNDLLLIAEHYMNNGYINFKSAEPKVQMTSDKKALLVTIVLNEGEKFTTGQLDFKGDLVENKDELAKRLKMKNGDVFSRSALRQEIATLTDAYADKGYAFANVNPLTSVNNEKKIIDIVFDFEKGEKVYIEKINIAGNVKTRDKVLRREIRVDEGALYSATDIKKSKQNLMNLGFFEEATIATSKGKSDNKLNLDVNVKEKPTGTFSIGGGYSSLDGFVAQGSVQQSNLFGYGLKSNVSVSLGGKSSTYSLGVTDPHFLDTNWSLGGDLYRTQRKYVDYDKKATGGDIKAGYQLSDAVGTFFMYKYEKIEISNESFALTETKRLYPQLALTNDSATSSITASISRNTTDYRIDPSSGMTNSLSVEFAGLGGTNKFLRTIAQSSYFVPITWGSVFMVHGTFGNIMEAGAKVPIDEKFYLGGIGTLRGYGGRTVSPYVMVPQYDPIILNKTGEQRAFLGGDTEAILNAEITIPLLKEAGVKGVLFYDIGNADDGIGNVFSRLYASYGLGIRWFSPIGPLRLEYGFPLNKRPGIDKNGKLEFSIGSFF
ncbi:MAG: outer membrane protein assembly factor BamA [Geobacteraceae bacterium]|nr:outer membrane protein assembly factor BamA [Geobacteraceae bacterium]